MAKENVKKFIERVNGDEDLRRQIEEQLETVTDENTIAEQLATFGEKVGLPFTPAEYKIESKKVSADQLDDVAGGTEREMTDLEFLMKKGFYNKRLEEVNKGSIFKFGHTDILGKLGIEADLSGGFLGTGLGSKNNTYRDKETGQMILHSEVVEYIKTGEKTWRK